MSPDPDQPDFLGGSSGATGSGPKRSGLEAIFLGPHGIRAGWRAAMYVTLFLMFTLLLQLPVQPGEMTPGPLFAQESIAALSALAAAVVMSWFEGRRFGDYGMPWRKAFRGEFWQGALWGIGTLSVLVWLIRLLGGYSFGEMALHGAELARYALVWAAVFLVVGVFEEFFFRGYLQLTLASGMRFWPAALVTSLAFGAVHLRNPGEGPVGAASVFVTGMFLCLTLRRTGALWFAIGWHAAYDFSETFLYSVPNSGIVLPGHLLASSFHGPVWLTGGSIGPEGSAFDFVIMAILFVVFDRVYRPRKADPSVAAATPE